VVSNAVNHVFAGRALLWATLGGGLALWQVSGAVRAVMGALARIYDSPAQRSFVKRYSISFVLSIEIGACYMLAGVCLLFAPFVSAPQLVGLSRQPAHRWASASVRLCVGSTEWILFPTPRARPATSA
jgi:uncharacterized BrkB/YihY/UPF0761 family membrane protein